MNIIIPLGGKGERFLSNGYKEPKPLIKIFDKEMIFYVLDNLKLEPQDKVFIIYYNLKRELFESKILQKYPNIVFIELHEQTKGASETIYRGLETIKNITKNKKTMLFDCDTFYTQDVISLYRNTQSNAVFYVNNKEQNPIYSYIKLDDNNNIEEIREKIKISDNANTGIYCFEDIEQLYEYSKKVTIENITFKNECYTSCIIDIMIHDNKKFIGIELYNRYIFNLGTPLQLEKYINQSDCFLFDLDGTIVKSESVYYDVWKEILLEYNIILTDEIFKSKISGNNDSTVINSFLHDKDIHIHELSEKKDNLFIKYIEKVILIDGVKELFDIIKKNGHKIAIVTNCNRKVSEYILKYFNIDSYIDILVISNECKNPKPYPDPYIFAINYFNTTSDKCIIFEDSKSGLMSANSVSPKFLVGVETIYKYDELLEYNIDMSLKDFTHFDLNIINKKNPEICDLKNMIKSSLIDKNIKDIKISSNKLKGGFISDVLKVDITTGENLIVDCVLKLENANDTFLSQMSRQLDLYNREYYFYDLISKYCPIKFPKFYGLIKDSQFNTVGVLLENLNKENFVLNLNLNNELINVSLNVIESLAKLHSHFWGKSIDKHFRELKKNDNDIFNPYMGDFIKSKWSLFKNKWENILSNEQILLAENIVDNFSIIQKNLSDKNLTFCHGDVKSANIFYKKIDNNYEPYFLDWQYIAFGKGVQDLVFFMIESFDIENTRTNKNLFKEYYYVKLLEKGVKNYSREEYEKDFICASYYFPFFVAIWFGTINEDELIDKEFPITFIKKLFNFYSLESHQLFKKETASSEI